jgi:hypothetical protein
MTIAVAIRTGTAVVFASDSKVTTVAPSGVDVEGKPVFQHQSYDNAFKIVHDRTQTAMAMFVGTVNFGPVDAMSVFSKMELGLDVSPPLQDTRIQELAANLQARRETVWGGLGLEKAKWPGPLVLLAAPPAQAVTPRLWHLDFSKGDPAIQELFLAGPGVFLEGSTQQALSLLYGFDTRLRMSLKDTLPASQPVMDEAFSKFSPDSPINKINFWAMPIQDAIDLAVFLAQVQIQMERFLPGLPTCGGPIDVMVMEMTPEPKIRFFPGKQIHHPMGLKP